jgi:hypothetical protein
VPFSTSTIATELGDGFLTTVLFAVRPLIAGSALPPI